MTAIGPCRYSLRPLAPQAMPGGGVAVCMSACSLTMAVAHHFSGETSKHAGRKKLAPGRPSRPFRGREMPWRAPKFGMSGPIFRPLDRNRTLISVPGCPIPVPSGSVSVRPVELFVPFPCSSVPEHDSCLWHASIPILAFRLSGSGRSCLSWQGGTVVNRAHSTPEPIQRVAKGRDYGNIFRD